MNSKVAAGDTVQDFDDPDFPKSQHDDKEQKEREENKIKEAVGNSDIPNLEGYEVFGFDLDVDEDEVLKRYETIFVLLNRRKKMETMTKYVDSWTNLQPTILSWSVMYAIQGEKCVANRIASMQWAALVSSLLLTISVPLYITPPALSSDDMDRVFSALIGASAFSHMSVILGLMIEETYLQRPNTQADLMLARYDSIGYDMALNVLMIFAILFFVAAMLLAGFDREFIDGIIHIYVGVVVIVLVYILIRGTGVAGDKYQDTRALQFYKVYCQKNGRLKPDYLKRVYKERSIMPPEQSEKGLDDKFSPREFFAKLVTKICHGDKSQHGSA
jgi:hypothetical protein